MAAADITVGSIFASTLLLSFAFALFLAGAFGAFYGQGRSRATGFLLSLVAVLLMGLCAALTWEIVPGIQPRFDPDTVGRATVAVLAGTLGTAMAVGLFVTLVMRRR